MAEELGFEPRGDYSPAVFKTAALNHSTILPSYLYKMPLLSRFVKFYLPENGIFLLLMTLVTCKIAQLVAYYI